MTETYYDIERWLSGRWMRWDTEQRIERARESLETEKREFETIPCRLVKRTITREVVE